MNLSSLNASNLATLPAFGDGSGTNEIRCLFFSRRTFLGIVPRATSHIAYRIASKSKKLSSVGLAEAFLLQSVDFVSDAFLVTLRQIFHLI